MTEIDLVREIRDYCQAHADAATAQKYARYFKEGYDAWGFLDAKHPFFAEKEPEWRAKYASLGLNGFLKAGALLFQSGKYEEGSVAIRFIKPYCDKLNARALRGLARWFENGIVTGRTPTSCVAKSSPRSSPPAPDTIHATQPARVTAAASRKRRQGTRARAPRSGLCRLRISAVAWNQSFTGLRYRCGRPFFNSSTCSNRLTP